MLRENDARGNRNGTKIKAMTTMMRLSYFVSV
jgi:hypothetical protein